MFDGTILNQSTIDLFSEQAIGTSYALGIQLSNRVGYRTFEHGEAYRDSVPMHATSLT